MFNMLKLLIESGKDKDVMIARINALFKGGKLTEEEVEKLQELM